MRQLHLLLFAPGKKESDRDMSNLNQLQALALDNVTRAIELAEEETRKLLKLREAIKTASIRELRYTLDDLEGEPDECRAYLEMLEDPSEEDVRETIGDRQFDSERDARAERL